MRLSRALVVGGVPAAKVVCGVNGKELVFGEVTWDGRHGLAMNLDGGDTEIREALNSITGSTMNQLVHFKPGAAEASAMFSSVRW